MKIKESLNSNIAKNHSDLKDSQSESQAKSKKKIFIANLF